MFKKKNKIQKRINTISDIKLHTAVSYNEKRDYYYFLDSLKEDIKKQNKNSIKDKCGRQINYIHFRENDNTVHPQSNPKENILKITPDKKPLNLKDKEGFKSFLYSIKEIDIFNNEYLDKSIEKDQSLEKHIINLIISEIYKYIEAKYSDREDLNLRDILYCVKNYISVFRKYEEFTEKKIHSSEVFNLIDNFLRKESTVCLMDQVNNSIDENIVHEKLDFNNIFLNRNGIELFSCGHNYNSAFLNYFIEKRTNEIFNKEIIKMDIVYIFMDSYSNLLPASIVHFLRALSVRIIYPASDEILKGSHIDINSKKMHIDDYSIS